MRLMFSLGLGLLLLTAFGRPAESVSHARIELVAGPTMHDVATVYLPCEVVVQGKNTTAKAIVVDLNESRVKTKSGLWKTFEVAGGDDVCTSSAMGLAARAETAQAACTLERACDQERRYKFKMLYGGNIVWAYYPSANGWTTDTTLDLGDVGQHFKRF